MKKTLLLLEIIKGKGNIQKLQREGIEFQEIGDLIEQCIQNNLIEKEKSKIVLTAKGLAELEKLKVIYKRQNSKTWIEPENESRIRKINIDDIYLPKQDELYFIFNSK